MSRHIEKLDRWFIYSDRQEKLNSILAQTSRRISDFEHIQIDKKSRKSLYGEHLAPVTPDVYRDCYKGKVSKNRLIGCTGPFGSIARSDILWDTIVSIADAPHEEFVYDFTVKDSESFAVNGGVLVHNTATTDTPLVKPGDKVKAGQSIAHSNYVMPDGTLALTKNLGIAFMPGKGGGTFEDAITISDECAKKLTSTHVIGFDVDHKGGVISSKAKFMQLFPNKYTKDQLDKIGDNGMVKPGITLQTGDPIFLSMSPRVLRAEDRAKGNLHKILKKSFSDKSQTWEKSVPGTVADAVETRHGLSANIAGDFPAKVGDKLSSRYAAKGVIGAIVPSDRMFKDSEGKTVDILINPAALIGRKNPGMVYDALLGKIATKTGQKYVVPSFSTDSYHKFVSGELKKHGVSDTEDLFDPETGKKIPNVITGVQGFYKLEHTADTKWSAVDEGGMDQNMQNTKPGGTDSAKRVGPLDLYGLLSHGATKNLYDIQNYRTGGDPDLWRAIRMGHPLPAPKVPFIYDKFINTLKGAGINTDRKGSKIFIKALKSKDIDELVGQRELKNAETIDPSNGQPIPGGLMDQSLHGIDGKRWSYINLGEPVPNPILEEPLRKVLGLTENKMRDVLANKDHINGKTGTKALMDAFEGLDLDKEEQDLRSKIRNGSRTTRNDAVKKLNILSGIKKQGIDKEDFFMTKVPVLPSSYRPVSMAGRMMLSADANYLYKDLMTARDLHQRSKQEFGEQEAGTEKLAVYDSLAAVMGLGDPLHPKLVQKGVKGFIRQLAGSGGPKCYDSETDILTENGWINISEYQDMSVKVATLNPVDQSMEFQNPGSVTHQMYSGDMIHTKTNKIDLFVTPNHHHFVQKCIKGTLPGGLRGQRLRRWLPPEKIVARDLCNRVQRVQYVTAATNFNGTTPEYAFGGVTVVDKEAFAQFVGWWVAEGWIAGYNNKCIHLVQKSDTIGEVLIDDCISKLGLKYSRNKRSYYTGKAEFKKGLSIATHWMIYDKDLSDWLIKNCGNGSSNKFLSKEILGWEKGHQLSLLKAYLDGDGEKIVTKTQERKTYKSRSLALERSGRFTTTSPRLVDSIELLSLQCGLGFERKDIDHQDHKIWSTRYRCRIYGWNRVLVEYKDQTKLIPNWSGMVHCVTVPNGLVFVRRNGKVSVSGNTGALLSKVIGHTVGTVGRGAIIPSDELDMDQIGIPEKMAWKMYSPFVMRRLVKHGMPSSQAALNVERKTDYAKKFLMDEMKDRPVMYSRAPTLHRFNIMGAEPHIVTGDSIKISPLVVKPFTADFDGDAMNVHVPVSDDAVKEVKEKLMPSQNLLSIKGKDVHYTPSQEFIMGLYNTTGVDHKKPKAKFKSAEDVIAAYRRGDLTIDSQVEIG